MFLFLMIFFWQDYIILTKEASKGFCVPRCLHNFFTWLIQLLTNYKGSIHLQFFNLETLLVSLTYFLLLNVSFRLFILVIAEDTRFMNSQDVYTFSFEKGSCDTTFPHRLYICHLFCSTGELWKTFFFFHYSQLL